jgi:hypothetical protein
MTGRVPALNQHVAQGVAVIGGIGQTQSRCEIANAFDGDRRIATMAGTNNQPPRSAMFIDGDVDFGGAPAARASDRLGFGPPLPPAAERWALIWVASSISAVATPHSARVWKIRSQTPLRAQRTKRLYSVF